MPLVAGGRKSIGGSRLSDTGLVRTSASVRRPFRHIDDLFACTPSILAAYWSERNV